MLSFVEHVVLASEGKVSRDERENRSRTGGPGDDRAETMRHRAHVHGLRKRYHTKKRKGFRSPSEEKKERAAYKLSRGNERERFQRKIANRYVPQK
jgi:hypothetical protein